MIVSSAVLAICSSVFNSYARPRLLEEVDVSDINYLVVSSLGSLPQGMQHNIRTTLSEGYNRQFLVLSISAGLQVLKVLKVLKDQGRNYLILQKFMYSFRSQLPSRYLHNKWSVPTWYLTYGI